MTTAQEARDKKIYVIENDEIIQTTFYDHVIASARETTSPRGVMYKLFYDEVDVELFDDEGDYIGTTSEWILKEWLGGQKAIEVGRFGTLEEAENEWFDRTYKFDFLPDDQRDTQYWDSEAEARKEFEERQQYK